MEILEQYVQAVAHITAAVGQPFLLATENGRMLGWGGPRTTWNVTLVWADTVTANVTYQVVPAEYLATIAKVDRVVGAMLRLNIPCDVLKQSELSHFRTNWQPAFALQ